MSLESKNKELERRLKQLIQHISKTKKKCKDNNLWLIAGFDALKEPTDEKQQGPLINRLYDLAEENRKFLKTYK
jgi:hypothetical protein